MNACSGRRSEPGARNGTTAMARTPVLPEAILYARCPPNWGRGKDSRQILTQAFGLDDCLSI